MDLTGRCYCGAVALRMRAPPDTVAVCHCVDCRRVTGAAMAAFAAFSENALSMTPDQSAGVEINPGVRRWFCKTCGSRLAATFDYLPGQVYVPVGVLDFAPDLTPQMHCHSAQMLPWLNSLDALLRYDKSAREELKDATAPK